MISHGSSGQYRMACRGIGERCAWWCWTPRCIPPGDPARCSASVCARAHPGARRFDIDLIADRADCAPAHGADRGIFCAADASARRLERQSGRVLRPARHVFRTARLVDAAPVWARSGGGAGRWSAEVARGAACGGGAVRPPQWRRADFRAPCARPCCAAWAMCATTSARGASWCSMRAPPTGSMRALPSRVPDCVAATYPAHTACRSANC